MWKDNGARHGWAVASLAAAFAMQALVACGGGEKAPPLEAAAAGATVAEAGEVAPVAGEQTGEQLFQRCATCHQATGQGVPGAFPPLAGSEYANAKNPTAAINVVLHGLQGPVTVKGAQFNSMMPPFGTGMEMTDEEVAKVLTYVRSAWGNSASAVTAEQVRAQRAAPRKATGPMTAEELKALM